MSIATLSSTTSIDTHYAEPSYSSYWQAHVDAFTVSGMSRAAYCRQHEVNYDQFGYWVKKFATQKSAPFTAVRIKPTVPVINPSVVCTLLFTDGKQLQIHDEHTVLFILEKFK